MGTSQPDAVHLFTVLELFKAGSLIPVPAVERLIAGGPAVDDLLADILRSRAVRDDSWAPIWALVTLGERRSLRAVPVILDCVKQGNSLIHEAVEFALLRMGPAVVDPILRFLDENPGLDGRINLYGVLAHYKTPEAVDFLVAQLRRDEDCVGSVAWALAESRLPAALDALRAAALRQRDPEIREALEAAARGEELQNPLLVDWRRHWVWEDDDEEDETSESREDELAWGEPGADLDLQPRYYDLSCPVCSSRLEYDTREDDVNIIKCGRPPARQQKGRG
jgi:hypothetical protein